MKNVLILAAAAFAMLLGAADSANLLKNGDFKDKKGWSFWQAENETKAKAPGTMVIHAGKAVMQSVKNGCINQCIPVKPGETYLYTFTGINTSKGEAGGFVAFLTPQRKWADRKTYKRVLLPATGKEETVSFEVTVPDGCGFMSVQLSASKQTPDDKGTITYTKAELLKK